MNRTIPAGETLVVWTQVAVLEDAIQGINACWYVWLQIQRSFNLTNAPFCPFIAHVPLKSGKWAKELPRQMTASNPSPGFWTSSGSVNQLASSITEEKRKKRRRYAQQEFYQTRKCQNAQMHMIQTQLSVDTMKNAVPHWSKACSFLLSHLDLSAYFSILSLASTLTMLKPSSTNMTESTLHRTKHAHYEYILHKTKTESRTSWWGHNSFN